jgi:hypothetical protein
MAFGRSRFVAQMSLKSLDRGLFSPKRLKVFSSTALSIWHCTPISMSPISSRNRVPPSASSMRPGRSLIAPVKAPLTCPKSSLFSSSPFRPAQLMSTNSRSLRGLRS